MPANVRRQLAADHGTRRRPPRLQQIPCVVRVDDQILHHERITPQQHRTGRQLLRRHRNLLVNGQILGLGAFRRAGPLASGAGATAGLLSALGLLFDAGFFGPPLSRTISASRAAMRCACSSRPWDCSSITCNKRCTRGVLSSSRRVATTCRHAADTVAGACSSRCASLPAVLEERSMGPA